MEDQLDRLASPDVKIDTPHSWFDARGSEEDQSMMGRHTILALQLVDGANSLFR